MAFLFGLGLFLLGGFFGVITACLCAAARIADLEDENRCLRSAVRWQKENVA